MLDSNCMAVKARKVKCKLEATVIGYVEGFSVVVLYKPAQSKDKTSECYACPRGRPKLKLEKSVTTFTIYYLV